MDYLLFIIAFLLVIIGIIGAIVPGIPGPPISFLGLIVLHLSDKVSYSEELLITTGVLAVIITVLDYYIPIYGTKKFGGTKAGVRGSTIGLIVGVIVLPMLGIVIGPFGLIGIILGPFLGAYIGESLSGASGNQAMRSAIGSFIGFLAGTLTKLVYGIILMYYVARDIILSFF